MAEETKEPEKGLLFTLRKGCGAADCMCGGMQLLNYLKPMTFEEADDYALSVMQSNSYLKEPRELTKLYWVPFNQVKPVLSNRTNSQPLTADNFSHQCNGDCDEDEEDYYEPTEGEE